MKTKKEYRYFSIFNHEKEVHWLKPIEQKTLLYAISKIKPTDEIDTEYTFEIKDFLNICGLTNKNYTSTLVGVDLSICDLTISVFVMIPTNFPSSLYCK